MSSFQQRIADIPPPDFNRYFPEGKYFIDYGACLVSVSAKSEDWREAVRHVYGAFPYLSQASFSDFHVRLLPGSGIRRLIRRTTRFTIDGIEPFDPFPGTSTLPLYEWGVNWCFAQRFNQFVLLHAGALAIDERAVIMAAIPGSGKSTLSAAMMLRGFRLLSDEFGVLDPESGLLIPMLKPVALKNRSIDVIRDFSDDAVLGSTYKGTRKGDVAHLAPDRTSVDALRRTAQPRLIVFPQYREGVRLELTPQPPEQAFARLAFNSFNYALLGPISFSAMADLAAGSPAYELKYSNLEEAITLLRNLLGEADSA